MGEVWLFCKTTYNFLKNTSWIDPTIPLLQISPRITKQFCTTYCSILSPNNSSPSSSSATSSLPRTASVSSSNGGRSLPGLDVRPSVRWGLLGTPRLLEDSCKEREISWSMSKLSSLLWQIFYMFPLEEFGFIKIETMMSSFLSRPGNLVLFWKKKSGVRHFNQFSKLYKFSEQTDSRKICTFHTKPDNHETQVVFKTTQLR